MLVPTTASMTQPAAHEITLAKGRRFRVRCARPDDEPALLNMLRSLDREEVRMRFFGYRNLFDHRFAAPQLRCDDKGYFALVALPLPASNRLAGTAMFAADADGRSAEFALLVHHDYGWLGLGGHLLGCLRGEARRRGIATIYGIVLTQNPTMLDLARRSGFTLRPDPEIPGCVRTEISTAGPDGSSTAGAIAGERAPTQSAPP